MTPTAWGVLLGAGFGVGLLLLLDRVLQARRTPFEVRVLPYLRDLPALDSLRPATVPASASAGVFGPPLRGAADLVERILGGSVSIRRRLDRANLDLAVHDFRVQQVIWGLVAFVAAAIPALLV